MKQRWNQLSSHEQQLHKWQFLFTIITILAASAQLIGLWDQANLIAVPSVAMVILLQSVIFRKSSRLNAILCLLAAVCVFIMYGIGIWLQIKEALL